MIPARLGFSPAIQEHPGKVLIVHVYAWAGPHGTLVGTLRRTDQDNTWEPDQRLAGRWRTKLPPATLEKLKEACCKAEKGDAP